MPDDSPLAGRQACRPPSSRVRRKSEVDAWSGLLAAKSIPETSSRADARRRYLKEPARSIEGSLPVREGDRPAAASTLTDSKIDSLGSALPATLSPADRIGWSARPKRDVGGPAPAWGISVGSSGRRRLTSAPPWSVLGNMAKVFHSRKGKSRSNFPLRATFFTDILWVQAVAPPFFLVVATTLWGGSDFCGESTPS